MRAVTLSVVLAAVLSVQADFGPRANPDDQFRFFWLFHEYFYPDLVNSGFNLFINNYWNCLDFEKGTYDDAAVTRKHAIMDMVLADNCDYIEQMSVTTRGFSAKYPRIKCDGTVHKSLDIGLPCVFAAVSNMAELIIGSVSNHPACVGIEPASEVRDRSYPSYRPYFEKACLEATGKPVPKEIGDRRVAPHYLDLPDFPASRVLDDDYPLLKYCKWYWRHGDGWNDYQTTAKRICDRRFGRKAMAMYDPIVRVPPLWGSGGDMTHGNQWTYPTPEPYNVRYVIAEQQAMARGTPGQKVVTMIQGISYRSSLAPKNKNVDNPPSWVSDRPNTVYMTTPPDVMQEALWTCFATRLDGVGLFAIKALFDHLPLGRPKDAPGYQFTNPETMPVISNVFTTVGVPLGPLFKAVPERAPEVAMLESYASTFFADRGSWGWIGFIWQCGIMADCAHMQPYVLYEEEIARDGIPPTVKIVIAPHCDVLTRKTFDALVEFQKKGGIIVGDEYLVPGILPDLPLVGWKRTKTNGAADNKALHAAAARLKADLAPFYRPPSDSDNEHIVTYVRSCAGADYLFAINDRREFGDYVGQWKMVMERGLPNSGRVTVRRTAKAVYDIVRHESVPFRILPNGDTEIEVSYKTNDGRVFLVADRPLAPLAVKISDGLISVETSDHDVMIPVTISVDGEKPRHAVVKNGRYEWKRDIPEKCRVSVFNRADGCTISAMQ